MDNWVSHTLDINPPIHTLKAFVQFVFIFKKEKYMWFKTGRCTAL